MAEESARAGGERSADERIGEDREGYPWTYGTNPVPWWLALLWLAYFVWGIAYLVLYLI